MTMSHPLDGWLPNDARWSKLPTSDLRKQCAVRNLLPTGPRKELLQRILTYKQANSNTPTTKRHHLWQVEPSRHSSYQEAASTAETTSFEIARVVDKSLRKEACFRRDFHICDRRLWPQHAEEKKKYITVSIGSVLKCTCPSPLNGPCEHKIFVLRYVLNCPETYCWQRALLPSELQAIYQHSHAIRAFDPNSSGMQNESCICCFRAINYNLFEVVVGCKECKRPMHRSCNENGAEVRNPKKHGWCWICYEKGKWSIEKFRWSDRVIPAAPSTAPAMHMQLGPSVDVVSESIQREGLDNDDSQSSSSLNNQDSEEEDLRNNQTVNRFCRPNLSSPLSSPRTSSSRASAINQEVLSSPRLRRQPPRDSKTNWKAFRLIREEPMALNKSVPSNNAPLSLPGDPVLIWKEMHERREREQQHDKERQQPALPKPSSPGHSLLTMTPDEAKSLEDTIASRDNLASNLVGHHPSSRTPSSAAETSTCTATAPAAGTTNDQYTIDTPVEKPTSVPSAVSSPAAHPTSATMQPSLVTPHGKVDVDSTKAIELAQKCIMLAKESVQIRKKSEHEAEQMKIRHRRELKKIKKKCKQEAKRLKKRIKCLEKEVLKILRGTEVAA